MCDTLVSILPGRVLFAKNSDRNPNEGQSLDWQPRRRYPAGARLKCTWIEIPQVRETFSVLLSRPFWMWGAEIGANEHGVVIGNEAVYTTEPYASTGLTGMDLLRLALERSETAEAAVEQILRLLGEYGQGGGCGHEDRTYTYHNSFLIAGAGGAYVLETAGRKTAVETVTGSRSISNGLTIPGFAERYTDIAKSHLGQCRTRRQRTSSGAQCAEGIADFMTILRDHGGSGSPGFSPLTGAMQGPCVHAGGLIKSVQTTASWVAELRPGGASHWVTATAAPCLSVFKPVRVDDPLDLGPEPRDVFDARALFWRHERFQRAVMRNYAALAPGIIGQRDALERAWIASPPEPRQAFREADLLLARWTGEIQALAGCDGRPELTRRYWRQRDEWAQMPPAAIYTR